MPLSIQDLIKAVEKAKIWIQFVTELDGNIYMTNSKPVIDADILLAELKKMEEAQGKPCPGTHAGFCPDCH